MSKAAPFNMFSTFFFFFFSRALRPLFEYVPKLNYMLAGFSFSGENKG